VELSKKNLSKIFKSNANGLTFNWKKREWDNSTNSFHKENYNSWITCNKDSMYYTLDTIILYNYQYSYYNLKCDPYKEWLFVNKRSIKYVDSSPPFSGSTIKNYKINIKENNSKLILIIKDGKNIFESFIVLDLYIKYQGNKNEPMYVMVLKRD
jgi:hypothetical protein